MRTSGAKELTYLGLYTRDFARLDPGQDFDPYNDEVRCGHAGWKPDKTGRHELTFEYDTSCDSLEQWCFHGFGSMAPARPPEEEKKAWETLQKVHRVRVISQPLVITVEE